mmetsp:Transcript_17437/g.17278  ORF Transcript_17437/g.17278 Transcript_17437/m.17278 type:complete len:93 (+) Transcript_17437:249-527(+)
MQLGEDFETTFKLVANHLATEYATQFSAYQFFNSKEMIARGMMAYLDEHFRRDFHASIQGPRSVALHHLAMHRTICIVTAPCCSTPMTTSLL